MKSKILIVDDDYDVIATLETILQNNGYLTLSASDKKEAKTLALNEKPDLAILDVMMTTHYEGFELAKEFAEDERLRNIKVLIQTSINVLITTNPSIQLMAREYRKKPEYKDLQVILLKDMISGEAGIDYLSENGENIWVPVNGFLRKPVDSKILLSEVNRLFNR